jgi:hypothetical protein
MSVIEDIVDLIRHRKQIYRSAFDGDLARLRTIHGPGIIEEALRLVDAEEEAAGRRRPPQPSSRLIPRAHRA